MGLVQCHARMRWWMVGVIVPTILETVFFFLNQVFWMVCPGGAALSRRRQCCVLRHNQPAPSTSPLSFALQTIKREGYQHFVLRLYRADIRHTHYAEGESNRLR